MAQAPQVQERAAIVKRVGELFGERAAELGALITREMGKRPSSASGEAEFCSEIFGYYGDNGPALLADKPLPGHDSARIEHLPVGAVLGVMPWNYPYYQVARFAAPNLVAATPSSSSTPRTARRRRWRSPTSCGKAASGGRLREPVRHARAGRRDDR